MSILITSLLHDANTFNACGEMMSEWQDIFLKLALQKVSEYDQEIPQSYAADHPSAPGGRAAEHLY